MATWYGDPHAAGRAGAAAMLWAVRRVLGLFSAGVLIVRVYPPGNEDDGEVVAIGFGDRAIRHSLPDEFADLVDEQYAADETEDTDEEAD